MGIDAERWLLVNVRVATCADLAAIDTIYAHYVRVSPATFDLEPPSWRERERWFETFDGRAGIHCLVLEQEGTVSGVAWSLPFRQKAAYESTVEVSVYVHPASTGCGVGGRLYNALFDAIDADKMHRVIAAITVPNPASIALHERFHFEPVGTFTQVGRKFDAFWDVTFMQRRSTGADGMAR